MVSHTRLPNQGTIANAKPLDLQRWLKSLPTNHKLAWTTISNLRGIMLRVYKFGIRDELVTKNPVVHVETRATPTYKAIVITLEQTLAIIQTVSNWLVNKAKIEPKTPLSAYFYLRCGISSQMVQ